MNYNQTIKFLEELQPKEFRLELAPLVEACLMTGSPQEAFSSIHISGTNGKGSTAAFLESILRNSRYKVGLYTSPHLVDVRERIQINRQMISQGDLADYATQVRESLPDERMLSYFEFITLISFLYFKDQRVDMAVYETGLGGRLDATNVIQPKVAVITPISFDHTQHLGKALKDIATEKCGIIKRGVPTVVAYQPTDVMNVVRRFCDDIGSPLCLASPDDITVPLGLSGDHQRQNAACAVEAANLLANSNFHIENVEKALATTYWPGRLEVIYKAPNVVLDGAHNVAGAEALASYVRGMFARNKSVLLLGVLADKDVMGIVRPLATLFREIVCVSAPSSRAASPKDLAAAARSSGALVKIEKDFGRAISNVLRSLAEDDILVISGSLTMVGEAKHFFLKQQKKKGL